MAEPRAEPLTVEQQRRLGLAVRAWAGSHPFPSYRAFAFADERPFSPIELSIALEERGPLARQFFRMVRFGLEAESFTAIVTAFEQSGTGLST